MKNRLTVRHGMLYDLSMYLSQSGWVIEQTKGCYEVLRARKPGRPRPLLVHDRTSGGIGYSIDERDMKVYQGWKKDRRKRGLDPEWPEHPRCTSRECEPPCSDKQDCEFYEYGYCVAVKEGK